MQAEARARAQNRGRFRGAVDVPPTPSGTDDEATAGEEWDEEGEETFEKDNNTLMAPVDLADASAASLEDEALVKDTGESQNCT